MKRQFQPRYHTFAPEDFEWDPIKNESNIAKHGIDFEDAKIVFES